MPLRLRWLLKLWENVNYHALIEYQQKWLLKSKQHILKPIILLIPFGIWKNCLNSEHSQSKGEKRDCSNHWGISLLSVTYKIIHYSPVKVNCPYRKIYWSSSAWISVQQINYRSYILNSSSNTSGKMWEYNGAIYQLFIGFKKVCHSVMRKILYNILIEFCIVIVMKLG